MSMKTRLPANMDSRIQIHTFSLTISHEDFAIIEVSHDVTVLIGYERQELIGYPLTVLIGESQMRNLGSQLASAASINEINMPCTVFTADSPQSHDTPSAVNSQSFNLSLQISNGSLLVIFDKSKEESHINSVASCINTLRKASTMGDILTSSIKTMRQIFYTDRLMIYKFDSVGRIKIIAEEKQERLTSLLNHSYPESHIPKETREKYTKNSFHFHYDEIPYSKPLTPLISDPVKLSQAITQCISVKPHDISNMKFEASIAITNNTHLWGLIVFQHNKPKVISRHIRDLCELFAQMISWKIMDFVNIEKSLETGTRQIHMTQIVNLLMSADNWSAALIEAKESLCQLIPATGLVIYAQSKCLLCENAPKKEDIDVLIPYIMSNRGKGVFADNSLSSNYAPAYIYKDVGSGVLSIVLSVSATQCNMIMLFRKELLQQPMQTHTSSSVDTNPGSSEPWSDIDIETAYELRRHLIETKLRYYNRKVEEETDRRALEAETLHKKQALFIDTMCHEIRNPINGIVGSLDILDDHVNTMELQVKSITPYLDNEFTHLREYLGNVKDCVNHQKIIANDVLSFSALEQRRIRLEHTPMNLTHAFRKMLFPYQSIIRNKGLIMQENTLNNEIYIQGDQNRLKQVVCNLMDNAIKFTSSGTITASIVPYPLDKNHQGSFEIIIEDTGIGMTEEEVAQLFVPYSQANRGISGRYGGTGLGLAICQELAKLMKGHMSVQSRKNIGTKFTLYFTTSVITPDEYDTFVSPDDDLKVLPTSPITANVSTGRRVLIVEDNVINQKVLAKILSREGCQCDTANNGFEGVELYKIHRHDLIFMDFQMPVMDGLQATRQIRELETQNKWPRTYIACLTGNTQDEHIDNACNSGIDTYLIKPFHREELVNLINRAHKPSETPA